MSASRWALSREAALERIVEIWPHLVAAAVAVVAIGSVLHALLRRRDARAAAAWVGLILLVPALGALLYWLLGVNRIKRRAARLRSAAHVPPAALDVYVRDPSAVESSLRPLAVLGDRVGFCGLVAGNGVEILVDGDLAYPAMLDAIDTAERSVGLVTYIFDDDRWGRRFVAALSRAKERGVEVRVLIDSVGARYSLPPVTWRLRRAGVRVARFLPTTVPWAFPYMNLRTHRKILVVDGRVGFTGGMNIREHGVLADAPAHPTRDLHARLIGPVVHQLQQIFTEDWAFATREVLGGEVWFPAPSIEGAILARAVPDGPDEHLDILPDTILGALAVARERVRVMTPYFVPEGPILSALRTTAQRGVRVDVLMPARSNLALVEWASLATVEPLLEAGVRVWLSPPPFDHSKLMVVDGSWTMLGSANWDARSLRLNFELNVECYDRAFSASAEALVEDRLAAAEELTVAMLRARSIPIRLRGALARLLTPYL